MQRVFVEKHITEFASESLFEIVFSELVRKQQM